MVGQVDWFLSVWVWSVLVALDDFNCSLWLEAKRFDVNCTRFKWRSYTARFGSAILLPTHLKVLCVDYFRHTMSEHVSCGCVCVCVSVGGSVCVCVCVCAEGERLRETDREKDLPNFPDLFLYFLIRKWWHNNDTIKHLVFVLYSSHAKRPELYRPQKSGITPHKSEDSQGQCLKKDRLFPVLAKHTNKKKERERERNKT